MLITVYQTNTGHQAVSFNNESNAQNKFTLKCWSCHAFNIVHLLSSFCALCFAIFADEVVRFCLANIFLKSLANIFCLLPSFLKHFETSALLCVVKGILLDIELNLRYSLVLQISNIPYSLNKSVSCVKSFSLKNFTLSLSEAPKAHYFCFLLLIQSSGVQQKSNKATLPNNKAFSTAKLALCVQSLCLILHNNFFVFNIDNCWKSSHNLWTLPDHNSRSLEGLGFRSCYSASAQSPTAPFWKLNVLGELQESVLFENRDKSLRVKLVIVSLLEHNWNQQISHVRSFNSTRKVNIDESFRSSKFKPDTALRNVR